MTSGIPVFGMMTFGIPMFGVMTFGIQMLGVMTFGIQMFAVMTIWNLNVWRENNRYSNVWRKKEIRNSNV